MSNEHPPKSPTVASLIEAAIDRAARQTSVHEVPPSGCFACATPSGLAPQDACLVGMLLGSARRLPLCTKHFERFHDLIKIGPRRRWWSHDRTGQ